MPLMKSGRAKDSKVSKLLKDIRVTWAQRDYGECMDLCQDAINAGAEGEDLREAQQYGEACKRKAAVKSKDSGLEPIPVDDAVGDEGKANARTDGHLAGIKKTWNSKIYAHYSAIYNAEGKAAADRYLQQFTTRKVEDDGIEPIPVDDQILGKGAVGDRDLRPIPVDDTEWNDPTPREDKDDQAIPLLTTDNICPVVPNELVLSYIPALNVVNPETIKDDKTPTEVIPE